MNGTFNHKNKRAYKLEVARCSYPKEDSRFTIVVIAGELREAWDILSKELLENKTGAFTDEIVSISTISDNVIIQED